MMMKKNKPTNLPNQTMLEINGDALTIVDVARYARADQTTAAHLSLADRAIGRIQASRTIVEHALQSEEAIYGVNTGFGSLARERIDSNALREVQTNLIRSHAAGVGEPLSRETVRAMMLLLAASLSRGHSGCRLTVVERIIDLLNHGITPVIPSRGSVGASGDLAPLAHLALVLLGEGKATNRDGNIVDGNVALANEDLQPITLDAKEGLALINGTHLMTAMAVLALDDAIRLFDTAMVSAGMMIDACLATDTFLDDRLHIARNQIGQREVARRIREVLHGSEMVQSHREDDPRVQDPYSLRCTPQILGAVFDTIEHVRTIVDRELGAVTDNPQVFHPNGDTLLTPEVAVEHIISGGNFHGLPLAVALDSLKVAVSHLAGISERRMYFLLAASDSENPINIYLSPKPGLHSGMMIVQYTAAACCNEIQTLCTPASIANIPTSAGQEDYNSFGPTAGHQVRAALELATHVIAMEFYCAAEALEYHRPLRSGEHVEKAHALIRQHVPRLTADRPPNPDVEAIASLIKHGQLV